jgi:assimilatory nitrate reductase catalytic subunit
VALFNAMLHVMARDGLLDTAYIDAHTEGFELAMLAMDARARGEICEIPREKIVRRALGSRSARATLSLYCQGLNQSVERHAQERRAHQPAPRHRQIGRRARARSR